MTQVQKHYDNFLAEHYSWMCGDFDERVSLVTDWFMANGMGTGSGRALDLGCGSGIQSIALANLGFDVTAVDFNSRLLDELKATAGELAIETIQADLTHLGRNLSDTDQFDVIVCMGDTLTHLPNTGDVDGLLNDVCSRRLSPGGKLVLEFRDLTTALEGTDRVIPVRLEQDQIMLTLLEYLPEQVMVNDMMLVRSGDSWDLTKSAYPKLRLSQAEIQSMITKNGLSIVLHTSERGLCRIIAIKNQHAT